MAIKNVPPDEIVTLLLGGVGGGPTGPTRVRREDVTLGIRNHFLAIARRRFDHLGDEVEDAVQLAVVDVCDAQNLGKLEDRSLFWPWARRILLHKCKDAERAWFRRKNRLAEPRPDDDDDDDSDNWLDRFTSSSDDDPASRAERREILRRILEVVRKHEVGRLRLLLDRSEEEVCDLLGKTRDQVAQDLKRLRRKLRKL